MSTGELASQRLTREAILLGIELHGYLAQRNPDSASKSLKTKSVAQVLEESAWIEQARLAETRPPSIQETRDLHPLVVVPRFLFCRREVSAWPLRRTANSSLLSPADSLLQR